MERSTVVSNVTRFCASSAMILLLLLHVVLLLFPLSMHSDSSSPSGAFVDAAYGDPNITVVLSDPGTFSTTVSPRRIAVEFNFFFSGQSNVQGKTDVSIPVTTASQTCRFPYYWWSQAGILVTAGHLRITVRNPVLTWQAYEQDAFDGMQTMYMKIGASSRANIYDTQVCVFFERLSIVFVDQAQRTWQDAESRCILAGGFMATSLRPYEDTLIISALPTSGTNYYWWGLSTPDQRPADSQYCWRQDPDFQEADCGAAGGYFSYFNVDSGGGNRVNGGDTSGVQCLRQSGLSCLGYIMNWGSSGAGPADTWSGPLFWTGSRFIIRDTSMNVSDVLGSICTEIVAYDRVPGDVCHPSTVDIKFPTLTWTHTQSLTKTATYFRVHTDTKTISRTVSRSGTISPSGSRSVSKTVTRSKSFSVSGTVSRSISTTRSRSLTTTKTVSTSPSPSRATKSLSLSDAITITPTKSLSFLSKTKRLTHSSSHTVTGGSRTPTFNFFESCSEGWAKFGRWCYKHFAVTEKSRNNITEGTPRTFQDALQYCKQEHGATIPVIFNSALLGYIQSNVVGDGTGRRFWNGVYQDTRFPGDEQVWRTVYNRTGFNDFFHWDTKRRMPGSDDCVVHHIKGDLSKRIVGGNDAMTTYPCHSRAEVVCARLQDPWSVTSINQTNEGSLIAIEGHYVTLSVVGRRLPKFFSVQLQTTTYQTHSGPEGQPTHCVQTKPRNSIPLNGSFTPVTALNVTRTYSFDRFCNGTCERAVLRFPSPETMGLVRGHKYSFCFFFPYDYDFPLSSDEYRWDFLPNLYLEVAQSRKNFLSETCERRNHLIDVLYFDQTATDAARIAPSPWYFDGPLQRDGYWSRPGLT